MEDIYTEVFQLEEAETKKVLKDLGKKYSIANSTFNDFPEEDRDFLHAFSFICQLSYDVYLKKMIIEKIIDDLNSRRETASQKDGKESCEKKNSTGSKTAGQPSSQ